MQGLVDSAGRAIGLGEKLGSGGEGDVFAVVGQPQVAAKLYHQPISREHQAKLRAMVNTRNATIGACTAWPTATLHKNAGSAVIGFLMPKVSGFEAIHKLYSPAHRRQTFPNADWAFLVHVARNCAAAFAAVHAAGHVVADVNQGNLVVSANGVVRLIDCDSFQIMHGNTLFFCGVGVQHFTPPELQSASTFHGVRRSANHDNFGLAVICFHLLFMGRHPFAGVYRGPGDMPIEKAIAGYRFAFSANGARYGMKPPPNCIPFATVPDQLAAMFESAFAEAGVRLGRPTAPQWVGMLDYLRHNLRSCATEPVHKFFGGASSCPWCELEERAGIVFFQGTLGRPASQGVFSLEKTWRQIIAIEPPRPPALLSPLAIRVSPRPLPSAEKSRRALNIAKRILAVALLIGTLAAFPSAICISAIIAIVLFVTSSGESPEKEKRRLALNVAEERWRGIERRWAIETGNSRFRQRLMQLESLRSEYQKLDFAYRASRQDLQNTVRDRQLYHFLDRFYVEQGGIPKIGPTRCATLASFGIETAADVVEYKILAIPGFGPSLTAQIVDWRRDLERRFVFDPSKGVDPADILALDHRFRQKRQQLEGELLAGVESLNALRAEAFARARALRPEADSAAASLAQARADLSIA